MYQNEILQETCDCQVLSEDQKLLLITLKAGCKSQAISGEITKNFIRIAFSLIYPIQISIFINCGFWRRP